MNKALLAGLVLGLALFLALAAVALLRDGRPEGPSPSEESAVDPRGETLLSTPRTGPTAAPGGRAPAEIETQSFAPAGEEAPSTAPSPTGELVEVEIVRVDTGEAVPHARVSWWPIAEPLREAEDFDTWLRESAVEEHEPSAVRLRADRQGRVWVSDSDFGFVVVARTDELWGYASFGLERETPAQVQLAADLNLQVQVVDGQGRGVAGVPVALREHRGESYADHLTAHTLGPHGLAVLRHARPFLEQAVGSSPVFVVAVPGLFDPPVETPANPGRSSQEILKLVLPQTGSCEVVVEDESGQPVLGEVKVHLRLASRGSKAGPESTPLGETCVSESGGRLVFEHVTLGRDLVAEVTHQRAISPEQVRGPGPTRPGERVQLRARLGSDLAIWRGRLLDPSGAAVGGVTAYARIEAPDPDCQVEGTAGAWTLRTAEDGRFAVVTVPLSQRPERLEVAIYGVSDRGVPVSVARAPAPSDPGAGVHELGDFILGELPVAAEGEVVDDEGQPVAGALVTPTIPVTASAPQPADIRWPPRLTPMLTDRRGRFEIRGEVPHEQIALAARKGNLTAESVVIKTGACGVRVVLAHGGAIEGRVQVSPTLLASPILVQAARERESLEATKAPAERSCRVGDDGRFAVRSLPPGEYAVRIVHEATSREIGAVSGILVVAGQTTHDSRLDPLDLRESSRFVELELVDDRGTPVPGAQAFSRSSGDAQAAWSCTQAPGGRVKLLAGARPLDVSIVATGFLRKDLEAVDGSQSVILSRAGQLGFQIAAGLPLPEPPLYLGIELTPLDEAPGPPPGERGPVAFDTRGQASCDTPCAGRLRVKLSLQLRHGDSSDLVRLLAGTPEVIVVAAGGGDQSFEIRFDPDQFMEAARALKSQ